MPMSYGYGETILSQMVSATDGEIQSLESAQAYLDGVEASHREVTQQVEDSVRDIVETYIYLRDILEV